MPSLTLSTNALLPYHVRYLFIAVLVLISCVRFFGDPTDCSPPGSSVHGISQARIWEWVTISYSRRYSVSKD